MTTDRGATTDLIVGSFVYTADGERVGTVKEMRGGCFKVDASMQPDYWLRMECVRSATGGQVTLSFDKDRLGDHKVDGPDDDHGSGDRGVHGSTVVTGEGVPMDQRDLRVDEWPNIGEGYRRRLESGPRRQEGVRWEEAEPAYHYGYEMRQRHRDRTWEEAEPEMRASFSEWARSKGYKHDESSWDRFKENAREAFTDEQDRREQR